MFDCSIYRQSYDQSLYNHCSEKQTISLLCTRRQDDKRTDNLDAVLLNKSFTVKFLT